MAIILDVVWKKVGKAAEALELAGVIQRRHPRGVVGRAGRRVEEEGDGNCSLKRGLSGDSHIRTISFDGVKPLLNVPVRRLWSGGSIGVINTILLYSSLPFSFCFSFFFI